MLDLQDVVVTGGPLHLDLGDAVPVLPDLFGECLGDEVERDRRGGVLRHGHQATSGNRSGCSNNNTFFNPRREDILGPSS